MRTSYRNNKGRYISKRRALRVQMLIAVCLAAWFVYAVVVSMTDTTATADITVVKVDTAIATSTVDILPDTDTLDAGVGDVRPLDVVLYYLEGDSALVEAAWSRDIDALAEIMAARQAYAAEVGLLHELING